MLAVLYVIAQCVRILLGFVEIAMFLRAILSWFSANEENRLYIFLVCVTEPFIIPVRFLCSKIKALDEVMLDVPFFITLLLLTVINGILPVVTM